MDNKRHWEGVYETKSPDAVSWYAPHLHKSIELIEKSAPSRNAAIIDVGGGEATLVDDLFAREYRDLTVLDISEAAINVAKLRLGEASKQIHWLAADITKVQLPENRYDIWHDRAVFHFLTEPEQRLAYVKQVTRAMRTGGSVIVSTFGPQGPLKCSGLEIVRYDADALHDEFGAKFSMVESCVELHQTPFGTTQQFIYCMCRID
ncbi:methyltransferase domain-containing protein [Pseudoduganella sp. FT93W]|uniref:Methyltransferase domain-containing protein n=1 Tax=Duganella fentianensis TaxID=2692177 RepID=A0A845I5C0_9BURK|nr:class I SAM-dependent methyltransferase [Duganella fentianensis]MYN47657.1 methyltransferase domain-containing protein [Duganella fentianensis]